MDGAAANGQGLDGGSGRMRGRGAAFLRIALALFLLALAAGLVWGGAKLLTLGGSPYYALAGIVLAVVAVALLRASRLATWLYGAFLCASTAWAIGEVGLDGWQLLPRLGLFAGIGIAFLLPWISRGLAGARPFARWSARVQLAAGLLSAIVLGMLFHRAWPLPPDPAFQNGTVAASSAQPADAGTQGDWLHYGGDRGGARFSALDQITPANVTDLKPAWTARLGPISGGRILSIPATPIKVGRTLYLCMPDNQVIALDAETGRERWRHDPKVDFTGLSGAATCRGVSWYRAPGAQGACAERILTNTLDARLIALDAATGKPCADFGTGGQTDLTHGLGRVEKGYYYASSAPTVVRGKVVLGGWISDGQYWGEPSGVIRAYDAVTGRFAWAFDMGRPDVAGEPGEGESYTHSTPNSWAPMSADEDMGLVFAPTGNATPDYYGAQRRDFDEKYSSAVLALDADTGRLRWAFQTLHHDLWDYDVASQPTLVDIRRGGNTIKALIQPTKRGEFFVLDRATGKPLHAVAELPVPQGGTAPGERLSPTQPFSVGMPSMRAPDLGERSMWGITPLDQLWCRIEFRSSRYEGPLTPPGLDRNTIVWPGYAGGSNWGGVTWDADRGIMVANTLRIANRVRLATRAEAERMGLKPITAEKGGATHAEVPQANTPFAALVSPFLGPLGVPCNAPPYSMLSAVDLASGKLIWTRRFGTARDSGPLGIESRLPIPMGVPAVGGSVATRTGLTFIGASHDRFLRAFETATGKELWKARLPAGGQATPMTYLSPDSGRQFVVIVAGGSNAIASRRGDHVAAYALPQRRAR